MSTTTEPAYSGPVGRAYRVDRTLFAHNREYAVGDVFFLNLPPAHPHWPNYVLSIVHLRGEMNGEPARLQFPGATHELMLMALNPERHPRHDDPTTWQYLTPQNVALQFRVDTDEQAAHVGELVARALVDGVLPAEPSDYIGGRERWKSSLEKTAEHERMGGHVRAN